LPRRTSPAALTPAAVDLLERDEAAQERLSQSIHIPSDPELPSRPRQRVLHRLAASAQRRGNVDGGLARERFGSRRFSNRRRPRRQNQTAWAKINRNCTFYNAAVDELPNELLGCRTALHGSGHNKEAIATYVPTTTHISSRISRLENMDRASPGTSRTSTKPQLLPALLRLV
jgi:hypothetical protein